MRIFKAMGATALLVGLSVSGGGVANAAALACPAGAACYPLVKNSVASLQVVDNSMQSTDVLNGTLLKVDLSPTLYNELLAVPANGVNNSSKVAPGAIDESDLAAALAVKVNAPDAGTLSKTFISAPTKIAKIGGPFAANATLLGTVNLQAGTYEATTYAKFDRENATLSNGDPNPDYVTPTTETYPQVALRYGTAGDAGTIMGVPISKAGFVELTQSISKGFTVTEPTVISVYGFGYNEDRSGFGANQITVEMTTMFKKLG